MHKSFCSSVCVLLCTLLFWQTTALAADVTIGGGAWANCGLARGDFVSEVVETGQGLYCMVTDGETYDKEMILCLSDGGLSPSVYLSADAGVDETMSFLTMAPSGDDQLWTVLGDLRENYRVAVFQDGKLATYVDCGSKPVLGSGQALWKEGKSLVCWNGEEVFRYPLPGDCSEIGDIALFNGCPCFVDWQSGKILRLQKEGQTETVFSLPIGEAFQTASLASSGNEAYLSYRAGSKSGIIRLSDGREILETAGTILSVWQQVDGTDHLALAVGSGNMIEYEQLSICSEIISCRHVETYLPNSSAEQLESGEDGLPTGWRFTDSSGNQWIFYLRSSQDRGAITRVLPDSTTVRYFTETADPSFPLYVQGAAVEFNVSPFISDSGHTMVPVRGLAGILSAEVTWDSKSRTVTVRQGEHILFLTVGVQTAIVDGEYVPLEAPAVIIEGRTMVPLRFLAEALGWTVHWENRTVYVTR